MTFFFGLLDVILTTVMLFDTLGLAFQFRRDGSCDTKEYIRVCLSWILFLTICNLFSCNKKGFFGVIMRLIIFLAKASVSLPIVGGTLKIYKYLVEDGHAGLWYKKISGIVKSKLCKGSQCPSSFGSEESDKNNIMGETVTPQ